MSGAVRARDAYRDVGASCHAEQRRRVAFVRFDVMTPASGRLTGRDSGAGRLPDPQEIALVGELLLDSPGALPYDLHGVRILISAGGTREPLDPVRYLGNRSSGKQGYALARVAAQRGAQVTVVAERTSEPGDPAGVEIVGSHRPPNSATR